MKKLSRILAAAILAVSFAFSSAGSIDALAATTPTLGSAATYGILASTYTNTSAGTTVNGDIGFTTGPAVAPLGTHTNYGSGAPYATAGANQGTALANLNSQVCTFTFGGGAINLSTDTTHGAAGVYVPGVYCSSGAMNVGGPLTLNGSGTYIFRSGGALTSTAGAIVTLSGASACDVFWTPIAATTLAANTTFAGTVISNAGVTIGANTTWSGRSLAFGGTVTSDTDTITVPSCVVVPTPTPTTTPVATSTPTPALTATPTPTPVLTATPMPTLPPSVTATPTPIPTVAPLATPTPTITPAPTVIPNLPNTGVPPDGNSISWGIIMFSGILVLVAASFAVAMKKRAI